MNTDYDYLIDMRCLQFLSLSIPQTVDLSYNKCILICYYLIFGRYRNPCVI